MGIHDGHRKRLRQRFAQQGADGFQDHELLEYLLQFSLPRVDTNPLAHRLMDRFGSFSSVLDAPVESLLRVEGVGPGTAAFLSALPGVCRRYYTDRNTDIILNSSDRSGRYLLPRFIGRSVETVFLVCMDSKCKVLACLRLSEGNTTMASVDPAQVTREALRLQAVRVTLAHNHPGGVALPSQADLDATYRIAQALHTVNIQLDDHIIVADQDFVSLADSGQIPRFR